MWVRLVAVCSLGLAGALALRAATSPPSAPASAVVAVARDITPVISIAKTDRQPTVDENEKKIVTVEKIHIAALQANAKADPDPEPEARHRQHLHHQRWQRRRHRRN